MWRRSAQLTRSSTLPALGDDEAEADADGTAQAARRRPGRVRLGEAHAVDALAAAVGGGHGDRDLPDSGECDLVAVGLPVGVGGLDVDARVGLHGLRRDGCCGHAIARDALVLPARGVELAEVDTVEGQRGEARADGVGHVVAVDLVVVLVGHVQHRAVRPDAARAVVADAAGLLELLVDHSLEGQWFLGRLGGRRGQAVGEEALRAVVGDPDGDPVRPDAARVPVGVIEGVLGGSAPSSRS